jgi:hypothetical protein
VERVASVDAHPKPDAVLVDADELDHRVDAVLVEQRVNCGLLLISRRAHLSSVASRAPT